MTTTTDYGPWDSLPGMGADPEATITNIVGTDNNGYFDIPTIVDAYRAAINAALPDGVSLQGDRFYGPNFRPYDYASRDAAFKGYPTREDDGALDIGAIVSGVNLNTILAQHQRLAALDANLDESPFSLDEVEGRLPSDVHATMLEGRDALGNEIAYILLWTNRPYSRCPSCRQSIDMDLSSTPPAVLNGGAGAGGQVEAVSQMHGCGEWLLVQWDAINRVDAFEGLVVTFANRLAIRYDRVVAEQRARVEHRLNRVLVTARAWLSVPGAGSRVERLAREAYAGSETEPGAYLDGNTLIVWAFDPVDEAETITVHTDLGPEVTR